jgi:hypothetical protein
MKLGIVISTSGDVRVIQRCQNPGLARKSRPGLGVLHYLSRQALDCDWAVELGIVGQVNHPHSPATKLPLYPELTDLAAWSWR